jgi:polar amino acid transport system substrate-binding protein
MLIIYYIIYKEEFEMTTKIKLLGCLVVTALLLAYLMMGVAAQEGSLLDDIIKRGTIRVATVLQAYPQAFRNDKGEPDGYEVDVAKLLAEKLGVKLEIVDVAGSARISTIVAKKADIVLAGLTRTLERAKIINFCEIPYYMSGMIYVVRPDSPYKTLEDLQAAKDKLKVGVNRGGTGEIFTKSLLPDAQVTIYESVPDAYLALSKGLIDVCNNDALLAIALEKQYPDKSRNLPGIIGVEELVAAVAYGDFKWWSWCNIFFHEFNAMGDNKRIFVKWWGKPSEQLIPWIEIR